MSNFTTNLKLYKKLSKSFDMDDGTESLSKRRNAMLITHAEWVDSPAGQVLSVPGLEEHDELDVLAFGEIGIAEIPVRRAG